MYDRGYLLTYYRQSEFNLKNLWFLTKYFNFIYSYFGTLLTMRGIWPPIQKNAFNPIPGGVGKFSHPPRYENEKSIRLKLVVEYLRWV